MAKKTVDEKVAALKRREAAKLDAKVRKLRAEAILLEAASNKLRESADELAN